MEEGDTMADTDKKDETAEETQGSDNAGEDTQKTQGNDTQGEAAKTGEDAGNDAAGEGEKTDAGDAGDAGETEGKAITEMKARLDAAEKKSTALEAELKALKELPILKAAGPDAKANETKAADEKPITPLSML